MSKASQIILLCEDKAHDVFAKRFLTTVWRVNPRNIRIPSYPAKGDGSGKQNVEDNAAEEARAFRTRQASASTVLIFVVDADDRNVAEVQKLLDEKSSRKANELIMYVIPKWHIQTWLAYLDGVVVDEKDKKKYKNAYDPKSLKRKKTRSLIDDLSKNCKNNVKLKNPPESLKLACKEFDRIRGAL